MRICPSCGEKVPPGRGQCKACGYDFTERGGARAKKQGPNLVMPVGIALLVLLIAVVAWQVARPKPAPKPEIRPRRTERIAGEDSVPRVAKVKPPKSEPNRDPANRSQALAEEYYKKIDDLRNRVATERKHLVDMKRMTPERNTLLSQIEAKCSDVRGLVGSVAGAPNDVSRKAAQAVLDARLSEIRKMFAEVRP